MNKLQRREKVQDAILKASRNIDLQWERALANPIQCRASVNDLSFSLSIHFAHPIFCRTIGCEEMIYEHMKDAIQKHLPEIQEKARQKEEEWNNMYGAR